MEKRELVKTDRNGTKYWNTRVACDRCGGTGIYRWGAIQHDRYGNVVGSTYAGTCFKCGGAAHVWEIIKEYTPEYRAKLDAANEKRNAAKQAQREAERAEREKEIAAERAKREEERTKREAERLAEIERNRGHYIGEVGDKVEMTVTLASTFTYSVPCYGAPWKNETVTGYVFKTEDNATLVWKTTGDLSKKEYKDGGHFQDSKGWYDPVTPDEGDRITIKGTIKGHEEYNNVNQTILNRVKWIA